MRKAAVFFSGNIPSCKRITKRRRSGTPFPEPVSGLLIYICNVRKRTYFQEQTMEIFGGPVSDPPFSVRSTSKGVPKTGAGVPPGAVSGGTFCSKLHPFPGEHHRFPKRTSEFHEIRVVVLLTFFIFFRNVSIGLTETHF